MDEPGTATALRDWSAPARRRAAAIRAYRRLIAQVPAHGPALANLASLLADKGRRGEALVCYREALAAQPGAGDIWFNYGNALLAAGDHAAAIDAYRKAVRLRPRLGPAWARLGRTLAGRGEDAEAERCYRRALGKLDCTLAARPLAALLARQGHDAQALALLEEATRAADPPDPDLLYDLALRLHLAGRAAAAGAACARCLALAPGHGDALALTGLLAYQEGNFAQTVARWEAAAAANPRAWAPHLNLGVLYRRLGQPERAHPALEAALDRAPDNPRVLSEMAFFLIENGRPGEAERLAEKLARGAPELAEGHDLLGCVYTEQARHPEAAGAFARALRSGGDNPRLLANALFASLYGDTIEAAVITRRHRELAARAGPAPVAPLAADRKRRTGRPRIGYLSPDLRAHPVGYFIAPVLAAQHGGRFEITCYADVARPDDLTERCRARSDHWRVSYGWSDEQLARRVRDDGIDVLVGLAGYTAGARRDRLRARRRGARATRQRGALQRRAVAPVALFSVLCGAAGRTAGQRRAVRAQRRRDLRLLQPPAQGDGDHHPAVEHDPRPGAGCAPNGMLKARALGDPGIRGRILAAFTARGIDPARIDLLGPSTPLAAFPGEYARVDIALDPMPYNGATTTCDALWMGVPVLSLAGRHLHERMWASILHRLGRPEWVSDSESDYVACAVALAAQPRRIIETRATLREQMRASSLCDAAGFVEELDELLAGALEQRRGQYS